jgi:hypothetical protein
VLFLLLLLLLLLLCYVPQTVASRVPGIKLLAGDESLCQQPSVGSGRYKD